MASSAITLSKGITIQAGVIQALEDHCRQQIPKEGCGILAGSGEEISRFFPIPNQDDSTRSFSFEPRAYLETLKDIRRQDLEWLGILHSHPHTDPYPSLRDVNQWYYPELLSWILSFKGHQPRLSAYFIRDRQITPVIYRVVPNRSINRS
ncbi:Mov34/MPN/PAD-1 family protein [Salinithrix halophila]|uniref:Mov34/MPN/PAD-1 family protein n=1 Tax=Salinithrix halophila TaxID=1485204 RepID=A0ABV8JBS4_9BACL